MSRRTPPSNDHDPLTVVEELLRRKLTTAQACERYAIAPDQLRQWVRAYRRTMSNALDAQLVEALGDPGLPLDDLSGGQLSGTIGELSVADLVQTLQMGKKNARVTVSRRQAEHYLWCRDGEIVGAHSLKLTGREALYRIVSFSDGYVSVAFLSQPPPKAIEGNNQGLLLAAADRASLQQQLLNRLGGPHAVYQLTPQGSKSSAHGAELSVTRLLAEPTPLVELLDRSPHGDVPTLRVVQALVSDHRAQRGQRNGPEPEPQPAATAANLRASQSPLRLGYSTPRTTRRPSAWLIATGATACMALGAASVLTAIAAVGSPSNPPPNDASSTTAQPNCPAPMVYLAAGSFVMGTDSASPTLSLSRPMHSVALSGFCLAPNETTVTEYEQCVQAGGCTASEAYSATDEVRSTAKAHSLLCNAGRPGHEEHPINCVSHHQAAAYCAWVQARLPTEAEWEFAARGVEGRPYPWGFTPPGEERLNACGSECRQWHEERGLGHELQGQAYATDDGYPGTSPVGAFSAGTTPQGVADLLGNVFEWTAGGLYEYNTDTQYNPIGPENDREFVIRGGNFKSGLSEFSDPSVRFALDAEAKLHGVGFRCASAPIWP